MTGAQIPHTTVMSANSVEQRPGGHVMTSSRGEGAFARSRSIGGFGTASRLVIGAGFLIAAAAIGVRWIDVVIGLVAANLAVLGSLRLRGPAAPPLRATGPTGHCLNCVSIVAFVILLPVGAFLFYGSSMVIAAITGRTGCEVSVVSNLLRGRDDHIGCPLFTPIDELDDQRRDGR
ncbi:MAG: hypothetical protein ACT4OX_16185 [Actinomycetota bacterium]